MTAAPQPETLLVSANRLAQTRRSLMTLAGSEAGYTLALDQMGIPAPAVTPAHREFARTVQETEIEHLRSAELYLADPDICMLLDTAAPTMPDQVLREDDPLTPSGLIGFTEPLEDRTGTGMPLRIHGLSWYVVPAGHPVINPSQTGVGASVLLVAYVSTAELADALGGGQVAPGMSRWVPNSTVVWTIGTEIGTAFGRDPNADEDRVSPTGEPFTPGFYQRLAAAFWTLAKQPRLVDAEERSAPPRSERARYRRAGIERPDEPVRIVRMARRAERSSPSGEHRPVEWQHQWIVSGHWKNAWLPSKQTHRQVYVLPFRKGPTDKPFIGGERVFLTSGKDVRLPGTGEQ